MHTVEDHLCFCENISNKAVYFKEASGKQSVAPLGNQVSSAIKCSLLLPGN